MNNAHVAHPRTSSSITHARWIALALAGGLLSATAVAQQAGSAPAAGAPSSAPAQSMAPTPGPKFTGYLAPGTVDVLKVLPPAPVVGDTRYETDRQIFRETRSWEGSDRWKMAS